VAVSTLLRLVNKYRERVRRDFIRVFVFEIFEFEIYDLRRKSLIIGKLSKTGRTVLFVFENVTTLTHLSYRVAAKTVTNVLVITVKRLGQNRRRRVDVINRLAATDERTRRLQTIIARYIYIYIYIILHGGTIKYLYYRTAFHFFSSESVGRIFNWSRNTARGGGGPLV